MKAVESESVWEWGYFAEEAVAAGAKPKEADIRWLWKPGPGTGEWAEFMLETLVKRQVPTGFPLRSAPFGVVPELFLTDSERPRRKSI
jgi:hypothetical protein